MRKIFVFIIGGFIMFSAFGVGENVPTSKSYIDSVLVDKQDTIERTTGNNQALTNTGTAGEYGTKDIYDSTSSYAEQTDALIDAQTMNAAVQNAINAEFVCISWVDDDPSKDCLLMEIRGKTERRSPNLFDIKKISNTDMIRNNGDGTLAITRTATNSAASTYKSLSELAPALVVGHTYTFNIVSTDTLKLITIRTSTNPSVFVSWGAGTSKSMTQDLLDGIVYFYSYDPETAIISNIQIEEGTTATPYQPYGNVYIPAGE